jgi:hypothetical protein
MERMFSVKRTILRKFKFFLRIPAVFFGGIVFPLTFTTLKRDKFHRRLFTCHKPSPSGLKSGKTKAAVLKPDL